jgi:hypothetical protein
MAVAVTVDAGTALRNPVVGTWRYGTMEKPIEYRIRETEDGKLHFEQPLEQLKMSQGGTAIAATLVGKEVSGSLRRQAGLLHADLTSDVGERVGFIRLWFRKKDKAMVSNLKGAAKWGKDIVAHRSPDEASSAELPDLDINSRSLLSFGGIRKHPNLVKVPTDAAPIICKFAELMEGSGQTTSISGGRSEVFLTGDRSEAFTEFARQQIYSGVLLHFLSDLEAALSEVARKGGGKLSKDIVALVGGDEMQEPHIDLHHGQVQMIVALAGTTPTLVYDPAAERLTKRQVMKTIGVEAKHANDSFFSPIVNGGFPLVLPVGTVYEHMVPACPDFAAGDVLEMSDGIVHAGPSCKQMSPLQRVVIFSTYTKSDTVDYSLSFQYSLWDWALCQAVPATVAYHRLREVYDFSELKDMSIDPWTHYDGNRKSACHKLCTDPKLSESMVKALVHMWRTGKQSHNLDLSDLLSVGSDESDTGESISDDASEDSTVSAPSDSSKSTLVSSSIQGDERSKYSLERLLN